MGGVGWVQRENAGDPRAEARERADRRGTPETTSEAPVAWNRAIGSFPAPTPKGARVVSRDESNRGGDNFHPPEDPRTVLPDDSRRAFTSRHPPSLPFGPTPPRNPLPPPLAHPPTFPTPSPIPLR